MLQHAGDLRRYKKTMSGLNRRHFLWSGALFIAGCADATRTTGLPGMTWPDLASRPAPSDGAYTPPTARPPVATGTGTAASPLPRSAWTRAGLVQSNANPLGPVHRITLHHEGFPEPFHPTDQASSASRLELIRTSHRNRGWADIGYHYVIDRAGRVWEARPLAFQGAHVKDHNANNIGVMLIGNFDLQSPTDAQLASMRETVRVLRRRHNVSESQIHTHRELGPTSCPGRALQPRIVSMRSNRQFT